MGEHLQVKVQFEPQSQSPTQSQSQSLSQSAIQVQTLLEPANVSINIAQPSTRSEVPNASSQATSPPSKIPFRPPKVRKLSPEDPETKSPTVAAPIHNPKPDSGVRPGKNKVVPQRVSVAVPLRIVARSLSCEGEIEIAIRHLRTADPLLGPLIDLHQHPSFDNFQSPFLALTRSILYQQLAYRAGTLIYTRFIALCGGEAGVLPETVFSLTPQQLRQIGVSSRKASYLHDLAKKYRCGILSDSAILSLDDKSLFRMLTMVNGIGSWSVHMFMIFSLHRPDVLPTNDLNVRKGVQLLYNLEELPRPSQMDQLCEKWKPYRSVGSWYMWRLAEAKGASSSVAAVAADASLTQQQQQEYQHPQLLDPMNGILNLGVSTMRVVSRRNHFRPIGVGQ